MLKISMEILFILGYPTRSRGGIENAALSFAKGLATRGHSISVVFNHDGELVSEYRAFCRNIVVLGQSGSLARLAALILRLWWARGSFVYGHQANHIFPMWMLSRLTRSKLVLHVHLPPPERCGLMMRIGLRGANRFIFVSTSTLQLWSQQIGLNSRRSSVVHNGVDTARFTPSSDVLIQKQTFGVERDCKVIAFVGRLDRPKGAHILIEALRKAMERHPEPRVCLLIAGSAVIDGEDYERQLVQMASSLAGGTVRLIGRLREPEALYNAADIVVIPSVWPDPQPLVTTEALACGVPVLASRIGGIPEILDPFFPDFLFEPSDTDQLASKMLELVDWRHEHPALGPRCRSVAESEFGLNTCIERIEAAFETQDNNAFENRLRHLQEQQGGFISEVQQLGSALQANGLPFSSSGPAH